MAKIAIDKNDNSVVAPNQFVKCGDKWARFLYPTRMTDYGKSGKVCVKWTNDDSTGEYYAHIFDLVVIDTDYINDSEMLEYWKERGLDFAKLLKSMDLSITCFSSQLEHVTGLYRKLKGIED